MLLCPWDSPGKSIGVGFLPKDLCDLGSDPTSPVSLALKGGLFALSHLGGLCVSFVHALRQSQ